MASAWVHAVLSLITFGKPYFELNKQMDSWSQHLGHDHRMMGHDYYQAYGILWNIDNPFPEWVWEHSRKTRERYGDEEAEQEAVRLSHCYFDRIWDDFSREQRENLELALARFVSIPKLLKDSAGVDVIEGRIQYELDSGELSWVDEPELPSEYQRLTSYIEAVLRGKGIV